jgi:hypothetical protein
MEEPALSGISLHNCIGYCNRRTVLGPLSKDGCKEKAVDSALLILWAIPYFFFMRNACEAPILSPVQKDFSE